MHGIWDIQLQKCRDLENQVMGPSRSLEMSPCDRAHMTSYWRSIVTMGLSRLISEIFNVEKRRDFEIRVRGHSRSLKVVPFVRLCMVSYYCSLVTLSIKCTVFEIFDLWVYSDLETGLGSFMVIENYTIQSGTHDFLLTFHRNHRSISHRFRDKRRFPSKISGKPCYSTDRPSELFHGLFDLLWPSGRVAVTVSRGWAPSSCCNRFRDTCEL